MTATKRAMSEKTVSPSSALPKINVPPPRERAIAGEMTRLSDVASESVSMEPREPASPRSAATIRWDAKFAVSLIALLVLVNLTLVLMFAKPAPQRSDFVTALAPRTSNTSAPELSALAPASGYGKSSVRDTTTYISNDDRKVLLDQLQRTRHPGVVNLPAPRVDDHAVP
ncbi:MAG: hypothetical protein K2Q12_07490 [Rickettsiales bacterium]|nr:hypothetical protein [Rickettsiales bacterium]